MSVIEKKAKKTTLSDGFNENKYYLISHKKSYLLKGITKDDPNKELAKKLGAKWNKVLNGWLFFPSQQKEGLELAKKIGAVIEVNEIKESPKKEEVDPKFKDFIIEYFGENYNVKECKAKVIKSVEEYYESSLKQIIHQVILDLFQIPICVREAIYEPLSISISENTEMIDALYRIIKKWPEIKALKRELNGENE
jgi:hypothetical protein